MTDKTLYRRVLLKLSGEVFGGRDGQGLSGRMLNQLAGEIQAIHELGVELGIVIGGGNIFRGGRNELSVIQRTTGDDMGMLATLINSLALRDFLSGRGLPVEVLSALEAPKIAERFTARAACAKLAEGTILIFAGGTGNPFFTTDTGAALRAREVSAELLLKATNVDGIYSSDPRRDPKAKRFSTLSYASCLRHRLGVMDQAALELCAAGEIPFIVFDVRKKGNIRKVLQGETIGTYVGPGRRPAPGRRPGPGREPVGK